MCWTAFLEVWTCENNVGLAPKKKVGRRGYVLFPSVQDFCWLCSCSCKVQYESQVRQTGTENLFQPSKQKGLIGVVLAKQCENIGLTMKQCEGKSDRVCSACGRKIRTLHQLYSFVACALYSDSQATCVCGEERSKCCPPTSLSSPERSPVACFTNDRWHIVPGLEQRLRETIEIQLGYRILFLTVSVDTPLWKTKDPSVLRFIDRSDRNPPITATSVTF